MNELIESKLWYLIPFVICIIIIITFGYLPHIYALASGNINTTTEYQVVENVTAPCTNVIEIFNFQIQVLTKCPR